MKKIFLYFLLFPLCCQAQDYYKEIEKFRNKYIAEHLLEERSPIKYKQVHQLQFFEIDKAYQLHCKVELINDSKGFEILTYSGKKRIYYKYAKVHFEWAEKKHVLFIYQSKDLIQKKEYRTHLFLPFKDVSNSLSSFGGGRYIDLELDDIKNGEMILDFNKCYNPYCAYASGFNCPIPPDENNLKIEILAGEKTPIGFDVEEH